MKELLRSISTCDICRDILPHPPRPVVRLSAGSPILIIGQAPGRKVHQSGIPWDDKSGETLRRWLGVTSERFYDLRYFSILPMGFCYPGKGASGDLPPRPECGRRWHPVVLPALRRTTLTLLVGTYAQSYYLGTSAKNNLTETVRHFREYLPRFFPLVHPSPRNGIWLRRNPWFERDVVPALRQAVSAAMLSSERSGN
jgi:uracil-DNA glycosylase